MSPTREPRKARERRPQLTRRPKRRGQPIQVAHTGLDRACHHCGLPILGGQKFTPIYGHVYHAECWADLYRGVGR